MPANDDEKIRSIGYFPRLFINGNFFFFFYKARVQRHKKKGIEDSPTELECLADFSLCQVLIYIIKKRKK